MKKLSLKVLSVFTFVVLSVGSMFTLAQFGSVDPNLQPDVPGATE